MHNELTDIQIVQKYFSVDDKKAQIMIDKGLNLKYIRTGYIKNEHDRIKDKYQSTVDAIVDEELGEM